MTSKPELHNLTFSTSSPTKFVHIINNLLNEEECNTIIESHTDLVPSNVTPETIRDRETFVDVELADKLWERLTPFYGTDKMIDEEGCSWNASGLNFLFRLCRYKPGGKFSPHYDGTRLASLNSQSFMTVNMYLNTVPLSSKGSTRALKPGLAYVREGEVLAEIQPVMGTAAVFRHDLWHDGDELLDGVKYLLRTDVLYTREEEFDFEKLYGGLSVEAKGKKALELAAMLEDAGNQKEALEWYMKANRLCPEMM